MYAELLERLADDLEAGGATAQVLRGHEDDPGPSGLALRLAGQHPPAGARPGRRPSWRPTTRRPAAGGPPAGSAAVLDLLDRRGDELRPWLDRAPQTNEVGRSAALLGGLLRLVDRWPLPVRLFEIGASGGLNLLADRFRYTDDAGDRWGERSSPVLLDHAWQGEPLPLRAGLRIVERGGCDVSPVDVTTDEGRLTLTAYVWPDMTARHARLAGAIELARQEPVPVERADAASYVERLGLADGHLTVVWHSVMWQYVPAEQQERVTARLATLGADGRPGGAAGAPVRRAHASYTGGTASVLGRRGGLAGRREAVPGADGPARAPGHLDLSRCLAVTPTLWLRPKPRARDGLRRHRCWS